MRVAAFSAAKRDHHGRVQDDRHPSHRRCRHNFGPHRWSFRRNCCSKPASSRPRRRPRVGTPQLSRKCQYRRTPTPRARHASWPMTQRRSAARQRSNRGEGPALSASLASPTFAISRPRRHRCSNVAASLHHYCTQHIVVGTWPRESGYRSTGRRRRRRRRNSLWSSLWSSLGA